MPRVWPGPKGWGKCPVLQPLAQMLLAEAVGVELLCQGTVPSLCGATGTCQEIQHSQQPPTGPTLSAALSCDPPLCGGRQKLGKDAGRQGKSKERQATSPILVGSLGISQSIRGSAGITGPSLWSKCWIWSLLAEKGWQQRWGGHGGTELPCQGPLGMPALGQLLCHRSQHRASPGSLTCPEHWSDPRASAPRWSSHSHNLAALHRDPGTARILHPLPSPQVESAGCNRGRRPSAP